MPKQCAKCGKTLDRTNKSGFCQLHYNENLREEKIKHWLETGDIGMGVATTVRGAIRDYLYTCQDSKCAICNMKREWNEKPINFVLDHIDGDAANSSRENLRLICPNCDSQLDTFKSKNKNSARSFRTE